MNKPRHNVSDVMQIVFPLPAERELSGALIPRQNMDVLFKETKHRNTPPAAGPDQRWTPDDEEGGVGENHLT